MTQSKNIEPENEFFALYFYFAVKNSYFGRIESKPGTFGI
jgi:hypothetical protein